MQHRMWKLAAMSLLSLAAASVQAAAVIGQMQKKLQSQVRVDLPGGSLQIRWQGPGQPVKMTGPAEHVFDGQLFL